MVRLGGCWIWKWFVLVHCWWAADGYWPFLIMLNVCNVCNGSNVGNEPPWGVYQWPTDAPAKQKEKADGDKLWPGLLSHTVFPFSDLPNVCHFWLVSVTWTCQCVCELFIGHTVGSHLVWLPSKSIMALAELFFRPENKNLNKGINSSHFNRSMGWFALSLIWWI